MPLKRKETITETKIGKGKIGETMKNVNRKLLTLGVGLFATAYTANAAGTAAGVTISNQASVDYDVGGLAQTAANSNVVDFLVDRRVNFSVTSNGDENVIPNQNGEVLGFTLNHTGNYVADFAVAGSNDAGDDFDPSSFSVFVESGATPGYQALEDTATFVDELNADLTKVIYIVSNIPGTPVNGDEAIMYLTATAHAGGVSSSLGSVLLDDSGNADIAGTVQNVFSDGDGPAAGDADKDGKHSAAGTYDVVSASIAVTKSSVVVSDPINNTTNPKRIPGAVVRYTISIANTGGAAADDLSVTDTLDANLTYAPGTLLVDGIAEDDDASGADETNPNGASHAAGVISAFISTLATSGTKTVVFDVTVD